MFVLGVRQSTAMSSRPPGLGVLVSVIKDCTEQIVKAIDIHRQMSSKLQNLPELSSEEIREVGGAVVSGLCVLGKNVIVDILAY